MQELDLLLSRYARERYAGAPAVRQAAFEALLDLPDPQIADYLLRAAVPADPELAALVTAILERA